MRPTHLSIIGKSKYVFNRDVLRDMREGRYLQHLIQRIDAGGLIALSERVAQPDDVNPLVQYLMRWGIPRSDIRLKYPDMSAREQMAAKLASGLSALTFGPDVAEHDPGLTRYFITTTSFSSIASHHRHVVIGPKGSGKSAMLRQLSEQVGDSLVITPEHYATEVLDSLVKNPLGGELAAYVTTWKYTLLIEIFRRLVQTGSGDAGGLADLRRYLVAHGHLSSQLSLFERFVGYLRRITQIKGQVGPAAAEIGIENELEKLFRLDELLSLVPAMRRALRRHPFTVFIDELDQSWNNSETANRFLVSLLTAAIQLRGIDENLHVVVFLRSEIFDLLKPTIAQLDKLRTDIETIQWSPRELTNLIVSRAFDSLGIDPGGTAAEAITTLFPGVVPPDGTATFDYLLRCTSYRPREVIQFCNLAIRLSNQLGLTAILPDAVLRAEEEFSQWKLEYLTAENMYIYPRLDILLDRLRRSTKHHSLNSLDILLTEILLKADDIADCPEWLREGLEPDSLLDLLYRLEIVGIEKSGLLADRRGWSVDDFEFVFARPKGKPEQSATFMFHPGLWKALELV